MAKRRHWFDDEKREIVAQTRVPAVSVSRVARRYDMNVNKVFEWLRESRFQPMDDVDAHLAFLPVEIVPEPTQAPVNLLEPTTSVEEQSELASQIEIQLSNGHRLCISGTLNRGQKWKICGSCAAAVSARA